VSKTTRIVAIVSAAVVLCVIAVLSYLSGSSITIGDSLEAVGVFVAGLLVAVGLRRGSAVLLILALSQIGCAQPWLVARGTIAGAQGALESVEPLIPEDVDGRDDALEITSSALAMGELAVDMWEAEASDSAPLGWWKWAGAAARGFALVLDLLKRAGLPVPAALSMAAAAIAAMVAT